MALNTKDFSTLLQDMAGGMQAACGRLLDFTIGSILRALAEATATTLLWLQGMIVQVLATTRAATSTGADLDSFVADFGLTRLAASPATGVVTFARFTAGQQAVVSVGTQLQSSDGTQAFSVTADSSNANYNATLNAYLLAVGQASIDVPVAANTAGSAGNVAAGAINTLVQAVPGVDTVSNAAGLISGLDAESDDALRTRFQVWVASLSKATATAIGSAVTGVQQGLSYTLVENQDYNGTADAGYFYVVVDDGSGYPSSTLLSSVSNAIDAVRPLTSRFGVFAPTVEQANVSMTLTTAAGYSHATVAAQVKTALQNYINGLPLGQSLSYARLTQIAFDTVPGGVTDVQNVLVNGGTGNVAATSQQVIKAGAITVS